MDGCFFFLLYFFFFFFGGGLLYLEILLIELAMTFGKLFEPNHWTLIKMRRVTRSDFE